MENRIRHFVVTLSLVDRSLLKTAAIEELAKLTLHPREQHTRRSIDNRERFNTYSIGRVTAKLALSEHQNSISPQEYCIENGLLGQPILSGPSTNCHSMCISITHSEFYCAAIVSDARCPAGIDIDKVSLADADTVFNLLSPKTISTLSCLQLEYNEAASMIWVAFESLGKTLKTGLTVPLGIYEPDVIDCCETGYHLTYSNFLQYKTHVFRLPNGWLALTLPRSVIIDQNAIHCSIST